MSKRHDAERHLRSYGEIRDIMGAMKNLAMMETVKLQRFIAHQQRAVRSMENAARDFLAHYGAQLGDMPQRRNAYVLLGTERGFCGDLNDTLPPLLDQEWHTHGPGAVVVVGARLDARMMDDARVTTRLSGATVAEEVESTLLRLVGALRQLHGPLDFTVLHHRPEEHEPTVSRLTPFRDLGQSKPTPYPPHLNLPPPLCLEQLTEHYLFAALHELVYSALLAENQHRIQHMEGAIRRLEQRTTQLILKRNRIRQEEITEEIEVIMLSASAAL